MVVIINVLLVWLRAHGTAIVIGVLVAAGAIMVINGIYGLAVHS